MPDTYFRFRDARVAGGGRLEADERVEVLVGLAVVEVAGVVEVGSEVGVGVVVVAGSEDVVATVVMEAGDVVIGVMAVAGVGVTALSLLSVVAVMTGVMTKRGSEGR